MKYWILVFKNQTQFKEMEVDGFLRPWSVGGKLQKMLILQIKVKKKKKQIKEIYI